MEWLLLGLLFSVALDASGAFLLFGTTIALCLVSFQFYACRTEIRILLEPNAHSRVASGGESFGSKLRR